MATLLALPAHGFDQTMSLLSFHWMLPKGGEVALDGQTARDARGIAWIDE
jgi:hypothetical protein